MINTVTLIPLTVSGTPSGNYDGSSANWYSDPIKAANYYKGHGSTQTVWFNLENFQGTIFIQATLDRSPGAVTDDDFGTNPGWFNVTSYGGDSSIITDYHPIVVPGNFTWLRAQIVNFNFGTIIRVNVTY